uniref:Ig-like domain-containing protein n=1 Tax=Sinocyclocheilus rhinocerous TaxID=307959 RepID=A0A673LRI3_9TELE
LLRNGLYVLLRNILKMTFKVFECRETMFNILNNIIVKCNEFCHLMCVSLDLHVLQWRHSCAVELLSNGSVIFLQGADEYAYDGETLTFNLSIFTDLQREGKFITACEFISLIVHMRISRPEVYSSVKACGSSDQQVLVCLATGFYPKHVQMEIRRDQTLLPDEQLNSHGIRPNTDGSFQLMKSLQILPSDRSHYQCVVKHQTLTEPLIIIFGLIVNLIIVAVLLSIVFTFCQLRKYDKPRGEYYLSPLKPHKYA